MIGDGAVRLRAASKGIMHVCTVFKTYGLYSVVSRGDHENMGLSGLVRNQVSVITTGRKSCSKVDGRL
jgi:hypothetical protein